jgi:diguanylate cyclase (GGDEF)-like protein/PAS domain S-box-containing protein
MIAPWGGHVSPDLQTTESVDPLGSAERRSATLSALLQLAQNAIFIMSPDRRALYVNQQMCDLTGYSEEELLALPSTAVLTPWEEAEPAQQNLLAALGERKATRRYRDVVRKDGSRVPTEASISPVFLGAEAIGIAIEFRDRTMEINALNEVVEHAAALAEANRDLELYRTTYSVIPDSVVIVQNEVIMLTNYAFRDRVGLDVTGRTLAEIVRAEDLPAVRDAFFAVTEGGEAFRRVEYKIPLADAKFLHMEAHARPIDYRGHPAALVVIRDITQRMADEERFRIAVEASPSGMLMADETGSIVMANSEVLRLFGYSREELLGKPIRLLAPSLGAHDEGELADDPFTIPQGAEQQKTRGRRYDGTELPISVGLNPIDTAEGPHVLAAIADLTAQVAVESRLEELSQTDALTGLANRRGFEADLAYWDADARRYGTTHTLCFVDLDSFKSVNDEYGHDAGDDLLKEVAVHLQRAVRGTDIVARIRGDEFAVLLPHTDDEGGRSVAQHLVAAVSEAARDYPAVSASVGISVLSAKHGADDALQNADRAMYEAKRSGGRTWRAAS